MRLILSLVLCLATATSCASARNAGRVIVDCITADRAKIEALILTFVLGVRDPDWVTIEQKAIAAGQSIGGCALAEAVQAFLAPPPGRAAPAIDSGYAARTTLEDFRVKHADGATFHTAAGDL